MIRFCQYLAVKFVAIFLCFLILSMNLPSDSQVNRLDGPFSWAKKFYLEGMYRESGRKLKLLLSFMGDGTKDRELLGKIYLLLGAVNEKMGKKEKARENYMLAKKNARKPEIEEIDFADLVEYKRIILGIEMASKEGLIEHEGFRRKKRKKIPFLMIAGLIIIAGLLALLILPAKKPPDNTSETDINFDTERLGIEWIQIPAGEFLMGDNFEEGDSDEQPVHAVYLDDYFISKYEITETQFNDFIVDFYKRNPAKPESDRPVEYISWTYAENFCQWLSLKTGKNIHLPTEAQWEKAARSTDQRRYPWGNADPDCTLTNYCCTERQQVGSYPAGVSPYGVHDMAGNVAEWCWDYYSGDFYSNSPYMNPTGHIDFLAGRVVRGGSYDCDFTLTIRSTDRIGLTSDTIGNIGFRIVKERN